MIKSTITETETKNEFPKLMKSKTSGIIVFFWDDGVGVVIEGKNDQPSGYYSSGWGMDFFEDFSGTIQLSNL